MKVNWERSKAMSGWIVAIILAVSLSGVVFALNPSFSTVIQPGSMVSPPTYTVFNSGVNTFARDGRTGVIAYASTNTSNVIQTVIRYVKGFNSGGSILIKTGDYYLGTNNISITAGDGNCCAFYGWSVDFEPGAKLLYNGTGYAMYFSSMPAAYGALSKWSLNNPTIEASAGSCIQLIQVAQVTINNPILRCKTIGIDIDFANTISINGAGYIIELGNTRGVGTVGIRLGFTGSGQTNLISINNGIYVAAFESGIYAADTQQINILGADIEANKYGINLHGSHNVNIQETWFEANTVAEIEVSGGTTTTSVTNMNNNIFAGGAPYAFHASNGNYTYYTTATGNNWGGEPLYFGDEVHWGTIDITTAGTVTVANPGEVMLTFNPNPQNGNITGISTASVTVVTNTVTFPRAYPTGLVPKIFLTLLNLSDTSTRFGGLWVSSVSNTGFTWSIAVTIAGAGGSTVSLSWESLL